MDPVKPVVFAVNWALAPKQIVEMDGLDETDWITNGSEIFTQPYPSVTNTR